MLLNSKDKAAWIVGLIFAIVSLALTGVPAVFALFIGVVFLTGGAFAGGCRVSDEEHAEADTNYGLPTR